MFSVIARGKAKHEVHQSPQKDPGVPSSLDKKFIRATTFGLKPDGREDLRVGNPKSTNSWAQAQRLGKARSPAPQSGRGACAAVAACGVAHGFTLLAGGAIEVSVTATGNGADEPVA